MLHRNLGFKLLALALAVGLWFILVVREDMNRQAASAPVSAIQGAPLFGEADRFTRAVPVLPQVQGTPLAGYELVNIRTEPTVVALVGAQKDLQRISVVITEPISLEGVRGVKDVEVQLAIPDKLAVIGDTRVHVTLITKLIALRMPTVGNRPSSGD